MKENVVIVGVGGSVEKTFVETEFLKKGIKDVEILIVDNKPIKIKPPDFEFEILPNPIDAYVPERVVKPGSKAERNQINRRKFRK